MPRASQGLLFDDLDLSGGVSAAASSTFVPNMSLPVHRWYRYSAGFSAEWVVDTIKKSSRPNSLIFDPFAGSATTLLAAQQANHASLGLEAHAFVQRIAQAKLYWSTSVDEYQKKFSAWCEVSQDIEASIDGYPPLIAKCYDEATLRSLDGLRRGLALVQDDTPAYELCWLTLVAILRKVSTAGTAQWQYVLPRKQKRKLQAVDLALLETQRMIAADMKLACARESLPQAKIQRGDARSCSSIADSSVGLVITSPPYPNNYDYADATRLEMSFFQEIKGWGDLQASVRQHLVCSCSQHVPEKSHNLSELLGAKELLPIADEIGEVCQKLADIREEKGGRKTYHLMIARYFLDLAQVWQSLRRVTARGAQVCYVIGDSAPYGVYVPVIPWLGKLAIAAGFERFQFEKTRERNTKWKNRKHRVPLQEGRLWVQG